MPDPVDPRPADTNPAGSGAADPTPGGSRPDDSTSDDSAPVDADSATPTSHSRFHRWIEGIPLRTRLVAITAFLLVASLTITGLVARGVVERYLIGQVDAKLTYNSDALAKGVLSWGSTEGMPSDYYVRYIWEGGGVASRQTAGATAAYGSPDIPGLTYEEVAEQARQPFTVGGISTDGANATRWRVYPLVADEETLRRNGPDMAFVALPLASMDRTLNFLTRSLVMAGLGIILLGVVLAWMMIGRSLRQLRQIETTAAAIAAGELSRRVTAPPPNTEVGSLAESLNAMLTQIESSFAVREASETRMRRFVSDASHELRTPLATIRGYGELYRMGALNGPDGPDAERVADTMHRVEDAARRMGMLVNDLLTLARLDEGRPLARGAVDVVTLARDSAQDLRALDPSREVHVTGLTGDDDGEPAGPVVAEGDVDRLRQVLTNLIGNVARHTPAGTAAQIAVGHDSEGWVAMEVRDHGPGVPEEQAARMFERFYRVDSSRNRESGGSGLGLAIVESIVAKHGGTIGVAPTPGGGLTVRVTLPAQGPAE